MIIYVSRTGNIRYIIEQLQRIDSTIHAQEMTTIEEVNTPFVLFTYTDLLGAIPQAAADFMKKHGAHCIAVICSGNTNFGHHNFCGAGDKLSQEYKIPIWAKLDLRGGQRDYQTIIEKYKERFNHE